METGFTGSPSYKLRNTFPCVARILDAQFRPSNTIKTYEIKQDRFRNTKFKV